MERGGRGGKRKGGRRGQRNAETSGLGLRAKRAGLGAAVAGLSAVAVGDEERLLRAGRHRDGEEGVTQEQGRGGCWAETFSHVLGGTGEHGLFSPSRSWISTEIGRGGGGQIKKTKNYEQEFGRLARQPVSPPSMGGAGGRGG